MQAKGQKEAVTEEYYVYGWKVLVLIEVQTRLPLTMKVVQIQDYEGKWLMPLLEQAQQNLGVHAQIATIVIDRGYLDGADLWSVHQKGIVFVICGKTNMAVTPESYATLRAVKRGEMTLGQQETIRRPNGSNLPIMVNALVLPSHLFPQAIEPLAERTERGAEDEPLALVVLQDVTALKESEYLKDEFLGIAAHELRAPLAVLKGYADMLLVQTARPWWSGSRKPWRRSSSPRPGWWTSPRSCWR